MIKINSITVKPLCISHEMYDKCSKRIQFLNKKM